MSLSNEYVPHKHRLLPGTGAACFEQDFLGHSVECFAILRQSSQLVVQIFFYCSSDKDNPLIHCTV